MYDDMSDTELVMRAKVGDQEAFAALFLRHKVRIYHCLLKVVANEEVARDLFQDTYIKAWNHIQDLRETPKFRAWLLTLTRNLAFDYIRKNPPQRASPLEKYPGMSDDPAHGVTERDYILFILKKVKPAVYRDILILDAQGCPQADIARRLSLKESSVRIYMSKAREQARQLYRRHLMDHTDNDRKEH